jgi:hypothetical protein
MIMSKFLSVAPITIAVLDGAVGDLPPKVAKQSVCPVSTGSREGFLGKTPAPRELTGPAG